MHQENYMKYNKISKLRHTRKQGIEPVLFFGGGEQIFFFFNIPFSSQKVKGLLICQDMKLKGWFSSGRGFEITLKHQDMFTCV